MTSSSHPSSAGESHKAPAPSDVGDLPRLHVERGPIAHMTFPRRQLDGTAVREMYETTVELSETHNLKLLIDLTDIPLISSGVMGMLVTMRKRLLHTGGQMHIAAPDPNVFQSFHVMNLHLVLTLFEDPARAAAAFKP